MAIEDSVFYGEDQLGRPGRRPEVVDDDDDDEGDGGACAACCRRCLACFRSSVLTLLIFLGLATGVGVGVALRYVEPFNQPTLRPRHVGYLFFPVELFVRLSGLLAVPMIASSLVAGSGSLRAPASARIGLRTLSYYVMTSVIAAGEGLGFVYAIRPGNRSAEKQLVQDTSAEPSTLGDANPIDLIMDCFRNLIPENIVASFLYMQATKTSVVGVQAPNGTTINVESFSLETIDAPNLVGVTFVSVLFGLALAKMGSKGRLTQAFFSGACDAMLTIIRGLLWLFPVVAVFSMAHAVVVLRDPLSQLAVMLMFGLTVLLGFFTHTFLVLPVAYVIFTRRNPFRLLYFTFRALLFGFISNSSTATMPVTMDCLEKAGIDPRIIRWTCPIGAIINMDGFVIYQTMACVFIATLRGIAFDASHIAILGFMTVMLSLTDRSLRNGWPLFIIFFRILGLPIQDIYLLLPYDWIVARFRTVVNIWSDAVGSGIVEKCSQADLPSSQDTDHEGRHCTGLDQSTDGAVLTGYGKRKDWTVRLVNPYGDRMVVSKV